MADKYEEKFKKKVSKKLERKSIYLQNGRTLIRACLKNKEELKQNENMNKINE
jgi:hypothetical protein